MFPGNCAARQAKAEAQAEQILSGSRAGIRGCGEFCFEAPDDGRSAAFLNDFVKLRTVVGDETDAFDQDVVDAPAGRKFYQAIDHCDRFVARGVVTRVGISRRSDASSIGVP